MTVRLLRRSLLLACAGAGLTGARATPARPAEPVIGDRVAWPAVELLDGTPWTPPTPGQDATVVVFFTLTCPYCARHNVHLQALHARSRSMPLRILGVAQDCTVEQARRYLQRQGLTFPVTRDHERLHMALSSRRGVPLSCVVDRQQRLREVIRGEMFEDDVMQLARWAQG